MTPYHLTLIALLTISGCGGTTAVSTTTAASTPEDSTPEVIGVTVETPWTKTTHRLGLASDSPYKQFTESSSPETGSDLSLSVSVAYVGSVRLKNAFVIDDFESGDLIAARVSIFDQSLKATVLSETTYTLYNSEKVILYENDENGLTVTAAPHAFDRQ